jgi:hypothetical protein
MEMCVAACENAATDRPSEKMREKNIFFMSCFVLKQVKGLGISGGKEIV